MIHRKFLKYSASLAAGALLLLASCTTADDASNPDFPDIPEDEVMVLFGLPSVYAAATGFSGKEMTTRGVTVPENHPNYLETLNPLPAGSLVWVLVGVLNDADQYIEQAPKAYRVLASGADFRQLYPCEVVTETQAGEALYSANPEGRGSHVLLKKGATYRFRMLSAAAANKLIFKDDRYVVRLNNGDVLFSNDYRYPTEDLPQYTVRTKPIEGYHIPLNASSEVLQMRLNPMIHQMAKMQLVICPGAGVHDLQVLSEGCELSGLEAGPREWGPNPADTLKLKFGPKLGYIKENVFTEVEHQPQGGAVHSDLMWETTVLPTDARNNSMSLLLNLRINGVPVQYMTLLSDQVWQHARSYNLRCTVSISGGITVFNFTTAGWSVEAPME